MKLSVDDTTSADARMAAAVRLVRAWLRLRGRPRTDSPPATARAAPTTAAATGA